ncbi:MAG: hypothetical protein WB445_13720 [Acinetobacter sp.]
MANFSALSMLPCWGADAVSACQICIYGCKKKNRPILSGQAWLCQSAFIYAALKLRRAGIKTAPEKAVMHDADFQHFIAQSLRGVIE